MSMLSLQPRKRLRQWFTTLYITVALTKAECVTVAGQEASVVVEVDSIGGDFGAVIATIADGLKAHGVEPSKVTGTFRGVSFKEFAMNGRPLG
ncbi:hypothetical protein AK812_SmicGene25817 [Symbiodinium microadriaticum]|uniref:Uncharacterized protein n=1 Tax=Symbiodinium microadriaticum TaxID=2951 RepID=A0A1Q9DAZ8_SYMMI|nr:hypothetical protein AK812_SmicGene25817 [Symbiodinium microadriaticum]